MSPDRAPVPARPTVAVLGTGTMGAPMARRIAAAGLPLRVWNRSRAKAEPLTEVGAVVADDVAGAVAGADVVVTVLLDADAVASVAEQARGSLAPGAVWLQMSTVGVEGAQRLAGLARDLGVAFVDAPVRGTKKPATDGTLVVLAAGPASVREAVAPVLEAVGSRTLWQDEPGAGSRLKLACNAWVLAQVEAAAESLHLAAALGVDPHLVLPAIAGGASDSAYLQLKGTAMLDDAVDEPSFPLAGARKDAGLIVEAATAAGLDLAVARAVRSRLDAAAELGLGGADVAATYRAPRTS